MQTQLKAVKILKFPAGHRYLSFAFQVYPIICQTAVMSSRKHHVPFGVHFPAAGTSNPRRCRGADLPADLLRSRWREDREEEETCGWTDGKLERKKEGGVIFTSLNHIQWMLVCNIWVAGGAQTARV